LLIFLLERRRCTCPSTKNAVTAEKKYRRATTPPSRRAAVNSHPPGLPDRSITSL
jgi:hypothetical protein